MKEGLSSFETSVLTRATQRNIPEDTILYMIRSLKLFCRYLNFTQFSLNSQHSWGSSNPSLSPHNLRLHSLSAAGSNVFEMPFVCQITFCEPFKLYSCYMCIDATKIDEIWSPFQHQNYFIYFYSGITDFSTIILWNSYNTYPAIFHRGKRDIMSFTTLTKKYSSRMVSSRMLRRVALVRLTFRRNLAPPSSGWQESVN
jgi:hypothetical protein